MKRLIISLMVVCLAVSVQAKGPKGKGKAKGHYKKAAAVALGESHHNALAAHVLYKIHVEGVTGEALAQSIHAKMLELKAAVEAGKTVVIPPVELKAGKTYGDDDLKGLGAFVAAKHAEGLKGIDLAKAVGAEAHRRHELRKQAKVEAGKGGKPDKEEKDKHEKGGKGGGKKK